MIDLNTAQKALLRPGERFAVIPEGWIGVLGPDSRVFAALCTDIGENCEVSLSQAEIAALCGGLTQRRVQSTLIRLQRIGAITCLRKGNGRTIGKYKINRSPESQGKKTRIIARREADGFHSNEEWSAILDQYQHKCARCGSEEDIQKDHILPQSRGGKDTSDNLQPLCAECNRWKGDRIIDRFSPPQI